MKRGNHWSTLCRTAPVQEYARAVTHKTGWRTMVRSTSSRRTFSLESPALSVTPLTVEKPASSGVCFTVITIPSATTPHTAAGNQNNQRQCNGGTCHKPKNVNPASNAGPILKMPMRPRLDHETKNAREPAAFAMREPRGVDFGSCPARRTPAR